MDATDWGSPTSTSCSLFTADLTLSYFAWPFSRGFSLSLLFYARCCSASCRSSLSSSFEILLSSFCLSRAIQRHARLTWLSTIDEPIPLILGAAFLLEAGIRSYSHAAPPSILFHFDWRIPSENSKTQKACPAICLSLSRFASPLDWIPLCLPPLGHKRTQPPCHRPHHGKAAL